MLTVWITMGLDVDVHGDEAMPYSLQHADIVDLLTGPPGPRCISLALELDGQVILHHGHRRAAQAARSASCRSAHERTLPRKITVSPRVSTRIRCASSSALRFSAAAWLRILDSSAPIY